MTPSETATLFLPGSGGRRAFWEPVAVRLRHADRPLFFPWPGFGDAPPDPGIQSLDDLFAWFLAHAPEAPSHVVAQSMGGVLALRFAIEYPHRVKRLVLVATSGGTRQRFGVDWRAGFRAERASVPDWFERDRTVLDAHLRSIQIPTLLLFGDDDPIAPPTMGEHLQASIPGSRLVVVPGGGSHVFAEERPDQVARAIDEHFASG